MKSNYVVILKEGTKNFEKVKALSKSKVFVEYDDNGNFCIIGNFNEKEIKEYEYYPLRKDGKTFDWQTESGFSDRALWGE